MKLLRSLLCVSIVLAGCQQQSVDTDADLIDLSGGAISVRSLPSGDRADDLQFEIIANKSGWIRVSFGPDGGSMAIPVTDTPARHRLRIVSKHYEGSTIIDRLVAPLFDAQAIEELRRSSPEADDQKLSLTTISLEAIDQHSESTIGPIVTVQPGPAAFATFSSTVHPGANTTDGPARLAGWLYTARNTGERSSSTARISTSIGPDIVTLAIDAEPVDFDQAGAVFRELTIEFSSDRLTGPATHLCAVANERCPAG